jgi:hypothetical protein
MKNTHIGSGFWIVTAGIVVGALVIWGMVAMGQRETKKIQDATPRQVALTCTTDMATQFHIHPNLTIIINGKKQVIPADTGITPTCMYSLHTHDDTGKLHVESPVQKDFTLSDFFAVWDKVFTKDQILDMKTDAMHTIVMTVNGQTSNDYENLLLKDLDDIVIEYKKI